jgi:hypothetical protein
MNLILGTKRKLLRIYYVFALAIYGVCCVLDEYTGGTTVEPTMEKLVKK